MAKPVQVDPEALDEVRAARELLDASRKLGGELLEEFEATISSISAEPARYAVLVTLRSGIVVRGALPPRVLAAEAETRARSVDSREPAYGPTHAAHMV